MIRLINAIAKINGGSKFPEINGEVYFSQTSSGVIVTAKINNLPHTNDICGDRIFGFHIHQGMSCTGNEEDEFKDARNTL